MVLRRRSKAGGFLMTSASPATQHTGAGPQNAFGLMRLVMATAVIVSHAFPIGGFGPDPTYAVFRGQADIGTTAVLGFFAISGYLITGSGRAGGVVAFLWRRALRILPAFWVVLLVTAAVVGPISYGTAHGGLAGYVKFGEGGPVQYVVGNAGILITTYQIDGVFPGQDVAGVAVVNGSLWSLFFEVLCYLGVAGAMGLGLLSGRRRVVLPALVVATVVLLQAESAVPLFARIVDLVTFGAGGPELYVAFGCGAVAALFPHPWSALAGLGAGVVALVTLLFGGFLGIGVVALSYAVLTAAHVAPRWAQRIGSVNDISYGVYIYAWPVAMLLAQFGAAEAGWWPFLVATIVSVLPVAAASWFMVERPAMRLKSWGPGRRRADRGSSALGRIAEQCCEGGGSSGTSGCGVGC